MADPLDTNVILRYLVEDPASIEPRFAGVLPFFEALARGERRALLTPLVLFQTYFVLTRHYRVPSAEAASVLRDLLSMKGLLVAEKTTLRACLDTLIARPVDLVDAYLAALCSTKRLAGVYSFDEGLRKLGVEVLPVG